MLDNKTTTIHINTYMLNYGLEWVSEYHSRQWFNIRNPRSGRLAYSVVCLMTHDCSRKL